MIAVRINRRADGKVAGFRIKGHAGYGEAGYDIVCAGVSAISQTAYLGLMRFLTEPLAVNMKNGYMELALPELSSQEAGVAEVILTTMILGLRSLRAGYPDFIELEDAIQEV